MSMELQIDFLRFSWLPADLKSIAASGGGQSVLDEFFRVFPEFHDDSLLLEHYISQKYRHYDYCLHCSSGICIFYDGNVISNKGVNVFLPSQGLWVIKQLFGYDDFRLFLRDIYLRGNVRFTRIDLCFDDYDYREQGHYIAEDFVRMNVEGRIVSPAKLKKGYASPADESCIITNGRSSATFYLGSRTTSSRMLRVYDKYYESKQKAKKYNDESLYKDCVRYEFEIGSRYADKLIRNVWIDSPSRNLYFFAFCLDS